MVANLILIGGAAEQIFQIERNHREKIVEIMRHAAGEIADGFHFLGMHQLHFGQTALADIRIRRHPAAIRHGLVRYGKCPDCAFAFGFGHRAFDEEAAGAVFLDQIALAHIQALHQIGIAAAIAGDVAE